MSRQLARSAASVGIATMTSRVLGLARDQVLAYVFGAGDVMDAFRIAFRIPNLLRDLFAEGTLSPALVPTFTRALAKGGRARAWRLGSNVITLLLATSGLVVLLGIVFAEEIVEAYAGGFRLVPGKIELTVRLTRIMLPFLSLVTVAAALMGMLNALHRFFIPALSPAMFNVATILCAAISMPLAARFGFDPIIVMAFGTLVGGMGQLALQWPAVRREGFRYWPVVDLGDPWLREIGRLMIPSVIGLAAVQINLFVSSWLATGLGTGAVSWLDYAFRLMYMPIGLFGVSIATATLPRISAHAATGDDRGVRQDVSSGLRMMLLLNIPATFGLIVLATPIVSLIFQRGRFTAADTAATAAALACYAPGLVGYSVVKLVSPAFYAMGDSRSPVVASAVSVGCNLVLSLALVGALGHQGLALGTATAALVNAGLLLWFLRARLDGLEGKAIRTLVMKISVASIAMAIAAYSVERLLRIPFGGAAVAAQVLRVFGAIGAGMGMLGAVAYALRIEEFHQLIRRVSPAPRT